MALGSAATKAKWPVGAFQHRVFVASRSSNPSDLRGGAWRGETTLRSRPGRERQMQRISDIELRRPRAPPRRAISHTQQQRQRRRECDDFPGVRERRHEQRAACGGPSTITTVTSEWLRHQILICAMSPRTPPRGPSALRDLKEQKCQTRRTTFRKRRDARDSARRRLLRSVHDDETTSAHTPWQRALA